MHQCLPTEVTELAAQLAVAEKQSANAQRALKLRHALETITSDFIPAAALESAAKDAGRLVDDVKQRSRRALREACWTCPVRGECRARIT